MEPILESFDVDDTRFYANQDYYGTVKNCHRIFLKSEKEILTKELIKKDALMVLDSKDMNKQILAIIQAKYKAMLHGLILWMEDRSKELYDDTLSKTEIIGTYIKKLEKINDKFYTPKRTLDIITKDPMDIDFIECFKAILNFEGFAYLKDKKTFSDRLFRNVNKELFLRHIPKWILKDENELSKEIEDNLESKLDKEKYTVSSICNSINKVLQWYKDFFHNFHKFVFDLRTDMDYYIRNSYIFKKERKYPISRNEVEVYRIFMDNYYTVIKQLVAYFRISSDKFFYTIDDIENMLINIKDNVKKGGKK